MSQIEAAANKKHHKESANGTTNSMTERYARKRNNRSVREARSKLRKQTDAVSPGMRETRNTTSLGEKKQKGRVRSDRETYSTM